MNLAGRTAIVTGAGKGIGKAVALRFAAMGANVAVVDLEEDSIHEVCKLVEEAGCKALPLTVDVTDCEGVQGAVVKTVETFGQVDILVNNAGGGWYNLPGFREMEPGQWKWVLDLNINGTLNFTHAVLGYMEQKQYGRIINLASIAGHTGLQKREVYSATKGAVIAFTKALAMELGPTGITVNSVSPGMINTSGETPPTDKTFVGRWGSAEEVAGVIAFLASDEASFITGADYLIDGGRVLGPKAS